MFEHTIKTSSQAGDAVLDCFLGSGTTAIAAKNLERRFVGCEFGDKEFEMLSGRLGQ